MGSTSSKAAKSVARATPKRQYPQRVPPNPPSNSRSDALPSERMTGPSVKPPVHASDTRDDVVSRDGADPDFARSLRSIGPVNPKPQFSNSSAFKPSDMAMDTSLPNMYPEPSRNPALKILEARTRLAKEAEAEFAQLGKQGARAREFLDVLDIRQILRLRDEQGLDAGAIEKRMDLKEGVVGRLGRKGVVAEPR